MQLSLVKAWTTLHHIILTVPDCIGIVKSTGAGGIPPGPGVSNGGYPTVEDVPSCGSSSSWLDTKHLTSLSRKLAPSELAGVLVYHFVVGSNSTQGPESPGAEGGGGGALPFGGRHTRIPFMLRDLGGRGALQVLCMSLRCLISELQDRFA